jgi:hypothetical protein
MTFVVVSHAVPKMAREARVACVKTRKAQKRTEAISSLLAANGG